MESKEKMIERIAAAFGKSIDEVKRSVELLLNTGGAFKDAEFSMNEFCMTSNRFYRKRRKPTNYTKPRNRKKKSKY